MAGAYKRAICVYCVKHIIATGWIELGKKDARQKGGTKDLVKSSFYQRSYTEANKAL